MLAKEDVIIAISKSGETRELLEVLPLVKRYGNRLITLTGNLNSPLAKAGDVTLDIHVKEEACPLNLAPTAQYHRPPLPWEMLWPSLSWEEDFKKKILPCSTRVGLWEEASSKGGRSDALWAMRFRWYPRRP